MTGSSKGPPGEPGFHKINYENWPRREIFEYFSGTVMYTTVHLDITAFLDRVKKKNLRFYPAMIHAIATVANRYPEYRYGRDPEGNLGQWDRVDPIYTVPRTGNPQLFSMACTPYRPHIAAFCKAFEQDSAAAESCGRLVSGGSLPPNALGVTAMPDLHFSSFAFGDTQNREDFTPFVVIGRYRRELYRVMLPVFGEFVHSVNDGFHMARFFNELEKHLEELQF